MTHTARQLADWFLAWAEDVEGDDAGLTNLKLQKLLYYAQGHYLGREGAPLFCDPIQAWAHGPVVPDVYHAFKRCGRGAIDAEAVLGSSFNWDDYSDVHDHLMSVWNTYGGYSAWTLREKTHREAPWIDAFEPDERSREITQDAMAKYFAPLSCRRP